MSGPRRVSVLRACSWCWRKAAVLTAESFRSTEPCPRPATEKLRDATIIRDSDGNLPGLQPTPSQP